MTDYEFQIWYQRNETAETYVCPAHYYLNTHEIMFVTEGEIEIRIADKQYREMRRKE